MRVVLLAAQGVLSLLGSNPSVSASEVPDLYRGTVVSRRPAGFSQKLLAITIDDGPDARITPKVLDALKRNGAKATFFVLGKLAARSPALIRRIAAGGHEIGSHTFSHAYRPTFAQAEKEISDTSAVIRRIIGQSPELFRPPGGIRGANMRAARDAGCTVVLWTLSSADTATKSAEVIYRNVVFTPNPGDIVLMHDAATKVATAEALPRILADLKAKGWRFVTVTEMLAAWAKFRISKTNHG